MGKLFNPDSGFMRAMEWIVDVIWVSILTIVFSLPIITIGTSITAAYNVCRKIRLGEGHLTRSYWNAWKTNFVKSFIQWIFVLVIGICLGYAWIVLQITPLMVLKIAFTILWLIALWWVFPLQERFENPVITTFRNAFIFGISQWKATLVFIILDALAAYLIYASWMYFIQGLPLVLILFPGLLIYIHSSVFDYVMKEYM